MLRQPLWVAVAILLAFGVAFGFLALRTSCAGDSGSPAGDKTPTTSGAPVSTP